MNVEKKYGGMTVNERLYMSGKMADFDKAVSEKDTDKVKSILKAVELDELSINAILEALSLIAKK
jgi:hypothetical protein